MKPLDIRKTMDAAKTKLAGLMLKRDKANDELNATLVRIANAIRGNPDFGLDCELYRSLGFVPLSERKSGKRKPAPPAPEPPADDADAV